MISLLLGCPACAQGQAQAGSPWLVAALMVVPFVVAFLVALQLRSR